jgi:hypothetical protein
LSYGGHNSWDPANFQCLVIINSSLSVNPVLFHSSHLGRFFLRKMTTSSGSTAWVFVDTSRTRATSQHPSSNLLQYVSPEELREQQKLLDQFERRKNKLERIKDIEPRPTEPIGVPSPRPRRQLLKSLPSAATSKHARHPTVSSTGATIGDFGPQEPLPSKRPPIPSPSSPDLRKHARPQAQPIAVTRPPIRAQSGPVSLQAGTTLLNVNVIGASSYSPPGASPPLPPLPQHYSFPTHSSPVIQTPVLELQSLPPGYHYALGAYFRPEANVLRPLRLLSLGKRLC